MGTPYKAFSNIDVPPLTQKGAQFADAPCLDHFESETSFYYKWMGVSFGANIGLLDGPVETGLALKKRRCWSVPHPGLVHHAAFRKYLLS